MSTNNSIVATILKHSRCIVANSKPVDDRFVTETYESILGNVSDQSFNKELVDKKLKELNHLLETTNSANTFFSLPLILSEKINAFDEDLATSELQRYSSNVLPYITTRELNQLYNELESFGLTDNQTKFLSENVKRYIVADRILTNHTNISKRFNIESIIEKAKYNSLPSVVDEVVDLIETYDLKPYQKMNICIEEMVYVLGKIGVSYDKQDLVKYIAEKFLMDTSNTESDIASYKRVLNESYVLEEDDLNKMEYLMDNEVGEAPEYRQTIQYIQYFLKNPEKTDEDLFDLAVNIATTAGIVDLQNNILAFFDFVDRFTRENMLPAVQVINIFFDAFSERNLDQLSREDLDKFCSICLSANCEDSQIMAAIKSGVDKLLDKYSYLYDESTLEAVRYLKGEPEKVITVQEFGKFKFTNLIKAAMNLEKLVEHRLKSIPKKTKRPKKFIKKAKNILFGEGTTIFNHISEDWKPDVCVAQYTYGEEYEADVRNELATVCREFNNSMINDPRNRDIRAYYVLTPMGAEVHVKENVCLDLTIDEYKKLLESEDLASNLYIETFSYGVSLVKELEGLDNTLDEFFKGEKELTLEAFDLVVEAMKYADFTKEDVELFAENVQSHIHRSILEAAEFDADEYAASIAHIDEVSEAYEQFEEAIPEDIKLESLVIIKNLLEDTNIKKPDIKKPNIKKADASKPGKAVKKPSNNKKDDIVSKVKDSTKGAIERGKDLVSSGDDKVIKNLNNIKLGFEGLKQKAKELSQKEKEVSKTIDMYAAQFSKAVKNALTSDRREGIIKGSVIPSFSRCIKYAIGFGVTFAINPVIAIIAAFGALAASKKLNNRERKLMLDELEVEMDVAEKEISNAEARGQMKKYRSLIRYKKELQRTYQRIKYNISADRDVLPGSSVGIKGQD